MPKKWKEAVAAIAVGLFFLLAFGSIGCLLATGGKQFCYTSPIELVIWWIKVPFFGP